MRGARLTFSESWGTSAFPRALEWPIVDLLMAALAAIGEEDLFTDVDAKAVVLDAGVAPAVAAPTDAPAAKAGDAAPEPLWPATVYSNVFGYSRLCFPRIQKTCRDSGTVSLAIRPAWLQTLAPIPRAHVKRACRE